MIDEPAQPTFEEMRKRVAAQLTSRGTKRRYAGEPGAGPVGMTCHECGWLTYTGKARPITYPKCGKTAYTSGDATTIRTRTAACEHFAEEPQVPLQARPASGENRYRQHNEK